MTVRLFGMTCGWITMAAGGFLRGERGFVAVPVPSYLIEHPKGLVLFDSGMSPDLGSLEVSVREAALGPSAARIKPTYKPGEDVASRLKACGVDPAQIKYMISSHLHFDHVGGNALLPNARWLIQKREWQWACSAECKAAGHYNGKLFDLGHDRFEVDGEAGEYDLFGDGTVTCIPTFGHTPGHQSLRVRLDDGDVILAADACYMRRVLETMHLPANFHDEASALQTFQRLAAMQASGAQIIFGHDPTQWNGLNDGAVSELTATEIGRVAQLAHR